MNDEIMEVEETTSAYFDEQLTSIYDAFLLNEDSVTEMDNERLNEILNHPKDGVSITDYLRILYMKGKKYEKEGNRNGARYCAMRILWMKECYDKPKKKRPRYLDMTSYTFDTSILTFMEKYTNFLTETYQGIARRLQVISLILLVIISVALSLFGIAIWVAIVEGLILCALNYFIQIRKMPDMFQKNQTNVIESYVEEALLGFDRLYRI